MTLTFSRFSEQNDLEDQRSLFRKCFPETIDEPPEKKSFYYWKFRSFPSSQPSYEYCARDEAGMAGYYAALPFKYVVDGDEFQCGMVCDVMTTPRLRGKGVFTKLGAYSLNELTKEGVDFVTGYPIRPSVIPGHLKVGWTIAFKLPMYLLPLRTDSLLQQRRMGFLAPLANRFAKLLKMLTSLLQPNTDKWTVTTIDDWHALVASDEWEDFRRKWETGKRIFLTKDAKYINWRLSAPESTYKAVVVRHGASLVGASFVRSTTLHKVPSLAVLDVMITEDDAGVFAALKNGWSTTAEQDGREVIVMMMSEFHAKRLSLIRHGFVRTPAVFSLILKALSERARKSLSTEPKSWHLMWIDSDDL